MTPIVKAAHFILIPVCSYSNVNMIVSVPVQNKTSSTRATWTNLPQCRLCIVMQRRNLSFEIFQILRILIKNISLAKNTWNILNIRYITF